MTVEASNGVEVRRLVADAWDEWYAGLEWAFGGVAESPEERALWRELTEVDRSIAAWDVSGGTEQVVGSFSSFSFEMAVPGGAVVPTGGVTMVSVAGTHRRQGLLRRMMRRGLDEMREAGEPLAALVASEPAIYGRFGYGMATQSLHVRIDTTRTRVEPPPGAGAVRLRSADPLAELARCEALYARLVPNRPGMIARKPSWEKVGLLDPERDRNGASPLRCVLAERADDGELLGYVRFALKPSWDAGGAHQGAVLVRDLDAVDPGAYAALLRFLAETDLTTAVELRHRPVDDPLLRLVSDVRQCRVNVSDRLFLRPVEIGAALAARSYATDVDVVLDVADPFCPWNEGRWRLSGGPQGATCARTADAAELTLTVGALGAAYLGGASLTSLAAAGQVTEERPGALAAATTAFSATVPPWLPHSF
ncbi:GNAT family N-acetyltransferase [Streptomyces sp. 4N509B]|uniref:GNAT family N-acetyltransferase n=1 Tax=Streptomyces sp. 4N509B TaxID=3457413 RepID=UPI003FD11CA7